MERTASHKRVMLHVGCHFPPRCLLLFADFAAGQFVGNSADLGAGMAVEASLGVRIADGVEFVGNAAANGGGGTSYSLSVLHAAAPGQDLCTPEILHSFNSSCHACACSLSRALSPPLPLARLLALSRSPDSCSLLSLPLDQGYTCLRQTGCTCLAKWRSEPLPQPRA